MKTGMQPVRKASVRRWLDWELPGMMRQKALLAICCISERCCCVAKRFCSNSRSVHLTCNAPHVGSPLYLRHHDAASDHYICFVLTAALHLMGRDVTIQYLHTGPARVSQLPCVSSESPVGKVHAGAVTGAQTLTELACRLTSSPASCPWQQTFISGAAFSCGGGCSPRGSASRRLRTTTLRIVFPMFPSSSVSHRPLHTRSGFAESPRKCSSASPCSPAALCCTGPCVPEQVLLCHPGIAACCADYALGSEHVGPGNKHEAVSLKASILHTVNVASAYRSLI